MQTARCSGSNCRKSRSKHKERTIVEDKLILLVEDDPHIMAINDAALHMRGYRTLQAETAH